MTDTGRGANACRGADAGVGGGVAAGPASEAAVELMLHRPMLLGLAYRLLGSAHDAEDVLQEAYLRWLGTDRAGVGEPRRYLSRVVTRLALDRLRARRAAREAYVGPWLPEPVPTAGPPYGPLDSAERRDSLSLAMLHLLERLSPPERAVYVLHTAFELPYTEIAEILDRSPEDCRQLQHRARAHLGRDLPRFSASPTEHRRLLDGFLAAARDGDLPALARLVRADATAWSDGGGRARAARRPIHGAGRIGRFFAGIYARRDRSIRDESIEFNARPGVLVAGRDGTYALTIEATAGKICAVYLIANPDKLARLIDR
jgi:RNA polymerase sigma-70 factor (ECF subfamily)